MYQSRYSQGWKYKILLWPARQLGSFGFLTVHSFCLCVYIELALYPGSLLLDDVLATVCSFTMLGFGYRSM